MEIGQWIWQAGALRDERPSVAGTPSPADGAAPGGDRLVLVFGAPGTLEDSRQWAEIRARHPGAVVMGCSTGGEIAGEEVLDDSIVETAVTFNATRLHTALVRLDAVGDDSAAAGRALATALPATLGEGQALKLVFVLSDGTRVNGTQLVGGCRAVLGDHVPLTGGLAGDGPAFHHTLVGLDDAAPAAGQVAAVGFYGDRLTARHGTFAGWDRFGPERRITRAHGNVLLELDGEPALDLYKRYLGDEAHRLPGSALLFPLSISVAGRPSLIRTVVGVDEAARTMTFAGDMPEGATVYLMRGHFDHLIEGAELAAEQAIDGATPDEAEAPRLALLVSCIGRKLLLGQRITDEVEACAAVLGPDTVIAGFYSYGELSPLVSGGACELHNQTMTITTLTEA